MAADRGPRPPPVRKAAGPRRAAERDARVLARARYAAALPGLSRWRGTRSYSNAPGTGSTTAVKSSRRATAPDSVATRAAPAPAVTALQAGGRPSPSAVADTPLDTTVTRRSAMRGIHSAHVVAPPGPIGSDGRRRPSAESATVDVNYYKSECMRLLVASPRAPRALARADPDTLGSVASPARFFAADPPPAAGPDRPARASRTDCAALSSTSR